MQRHDASPSRTSRTSTSSAIVAASSALSTPGRSIVTSATWSSIWSLTGWRAGSSERTSGIGADPLQEGECRRIEELRLLRHDDMTGPGRDEEPGIGQLAAEPHGL